MTTLTENTIKALEEQFAKDGTAPGPSLWQGIKNLIKTMERVVAKIIPPMPLVSELDPGVGKTSSAVQFIRALLESTAYKDVAVLYCVSRLDEIEELIEKFGNGVGVFTADKKSNALSTREPFEARVLITTQQMVDSRLSKANSFSELTEFHYLGKPRLLKIWDESLLAAEVITLRLRTLRAIPQMMDRLRYFDREAIDLIDKIAGKYVLDKAG
jgi:hypothetical protein